MCAIWAWVGFLPLQRRCLGLLLDVLAEINRSALRHSFAIDRPPLDVLDGAVQDAAYCGFAFVVAHDVLSANTSNVTSPTADAAVTLKLIPAAVFVAGSGTACTCAGLVV
jgi:hypothetical protein